MAEAQATGAPECPADLGKHAQWLWDSVVDDLVRLNVAKKLDTAHLWAMCEVWGLYRAAMEVAIKDPTDKDARIAVVSYLASFETAAAKCGLSPADRAKLTVVPEQAVDEFEQFLNREA